MTAAVLAPQRQAAFKERHRTSLTRFNLVSEPWIPCISLRGCDPVLLSLRDTLVTAHEQRELLDDSPLVVVALHRLLLAVLHRVIRGPRTGDDWKAMHAAGHFDIGAIDTYLGIWASRFNLFDPVAPFYQVSPQSLGEHEATPVSVAKLAHERASGNNITLFDHTTKVSAAFTPAQAARSLVAFQAFAIGGGVSSPFNLSDAPLARDYTVLVRGDSLFETLMLNLVRYDSERPIPWLHDDDPPWWEQDSQRTPQREGTPPAGYLDYLTWQSRRVHLIYDEQAGVVRECQIRQNLKLAGGDQTDPFKAYYKSEQAGFLPRRFREERAVWRDSQALLQFGEQTQGDQTNESPAVFGWLADVLIARVGRGMQAQQREFDVLGFMNDGAQATIILWRHERLPLPLSYLNNRPLRDRLGDALKLAEDVSALFKPIYAAKKQSYRRPIRVLAEELLRETSNRKPDVGDIERLVKHLDAERDYWSRLGSYFRAFMVTLAERMEAEGREGGDAAYLQWAEDVAVCARRTFRAAIDSLDTSGRSLRAQALAEREFSWQLRAMLPQRELVLEEAQV